MRNALLRIGLLALLVALTMVGVGGSSLAAGDLFDDDYKDCPHKTRYRGGQIADLSVNRDADDEDEVNVSWAATDPATWSLGSNAYRTSLVVILDDGSTKTKTLSLGSRKTTFDGVDTGREVTVQMAIVVDTADGKYLISDILSQSINQSLTKPAFSRGFLRVTRAATGGARVSDDGATAAIAAITEKTEATSGTFYYVGYNENFGNYMATGLTTMPKNARLRVGLAHSSEETSGERDDVDFDAYVVRLTDEDGDVISEGDDVATVESKYGTRRLVIGTIDQPLADRTGYTAPVFSNVRINDDGEIRASMQAGGPVPASDAGDPPTTPAATWAATTPVLVSPDTTNTGGFSNVWPMDNPALEAVDSGESVNTAAEGTSGFLNTVFAMPPDEHRDFPIDVFGSDETYKISVWAINDDNEVISPVASLKVRLFNETRSGITNIDDYIDIGDDATTVAERFTDGADNTGVSDVIVTVFTVLK